MSLVTRRATKPLLPGEDVRAGKMPPDLLADEFGSLRPAAVLCNRLADAGDQSGGTARVQQRPRGREDFSI